VYAGLILLKKQHSLFPPFKQHEGYKYITIKTPPSSPPIHSATLQTVPPVSLRRTNDPEKQDSRIAGVRADVEHEREVYAQLLSINKKYPGSQKPQTKRPTSRLAFSSSQLTPSPQSSPLKGRGSNRTFSQRRM
jgi:hypothetical protein